MPRKPPAAPGALVLALALKIERLRETDPAHYSRVMSKVAQLEDKAPANRDFMAAAADLEYLRTHDRHAYRAMRRLLGRLVANARQESRAAA